MSVQIIPSFISYSRYDTFLCIKGLLLELAFSCMMLLCQCGLVCVVEPYVMFVMFKLLAFTIQKC